MVVRAGGAIFVSKETKRVCLFLRSKEVSHPHTWGFIGGKMHKDEIIIAGITREIKEEMGFMPEPIKVIPIDVFKSIDRNFIYFSVLILVKEEFIPKLNSENCGYGWFKFNELPRPLHQGTKSVLLDTGFKQNFKNIIAEE